MEVGDCSEYSAPSFDLNFPHCCSLDSYAIGREMVEPVVQDSMYSGCSKKRRRILNDDAVSERVYQGAVRSIGGNLKAYGKVISFRKYSRSRRPNVICRVESFGRICRSFDDSRRRWVSEMGFGGLLHLVDMRLPRALCYWLMTRIDPWNEMLVVGDKQFRLSSNQVRWILGLPKGKELVRSTFPSESMRKIAVDIENQYGVGWTNFDRKKGKYVTRRALGITPPVVDRLMSLFVEQDAPEFKALFLMSALQLVLCPTQCSRFPKDLLPALSCATNSRRYDWCGFVLKRLMASVTRFGRRFYTEGFASGCSGCTLFLAIFYLDRLNRNPISWGTHPRVKVWDFNEMNKACIADRANVDGDFGQIGVLDIAYGETHPRDARDKEVHSDSEYDSDSGDMNVVH